MKPKDAGDVWRLMETTDPSHVRVIFDQHGGHPVVGPGIAKGRSYLISLFGDTGSPGVYLAVANIVRVPPEDVRSSTTRWMAGFTRYPAMTSSFVVSKLAGER